MGSFEKASSEKNRGYFIVGFPSAMLIACCAARQPIAFATGPSAWSQEAASGCFAKKSGVRLRPGRTTQIIPRALLAEAKI